MHWIALRASAVFFLMLGVVLLGIDLWRATDAGAFRLSALGEWWVWADRDSLLLLQPAVERHLSPALWDPGIQTLLEWPAALEALGLGLVLLALGVWFRRTPGAEA